VILNEQVFLIFFFKRFYLLDREREHEQGGRAEAEGKGEAESPPTREPDVGLDLRTLGS